MAETIIREFPDAPSDPLLLRRGEEGKGERGPPTLRQPRLPDYVSYVRKRETFPWSCALAREPTSRDPSHQRPDEAWRNLPESLIIRNQVENK